MLQNKIYQNYTIEILKTFLTILFGLSIIAWTVRAVNFLDLIVESGYPVSTYFLYSILNLIGVFTKFFPLAFLLALILFILKQIQENEFVVLWTSGVKKIQIVHLFFYFSLFISLIFLLFSNFITPASLNKSRNLLSNQNINSFLPTIRIQEFSDSFTGFTFIVDKKFDNQIENIFLQDNSNILKNISSNKENKSLTTIIASNGLIEKDKMALFNGQIISSNKKNEKNDLIKFEQLNIDLSNLKNRTIKTPKIQETGTLKLIGCMKNQYFNNVKCKEDIKKDILPLLNRRIVFPLFIPVVALIASLLLLKVKKRKSFNKIGIFTLCFLVLLYAELIIRYTGLNQIINYIFLLSPFLLSFLAYIFLKIKFSNEFKLNE